MATITKYLTLATYMVFFIFLSSSKCNKNDTYCRSNNVLYKFKVEGIASPEKLSYNVGDTIFFTVEVPYILLDLNTNTIINYSTSVEVGGEIGFGKIDTTTQKLLPALDSFKCISFKGIFFDNGRIEKSGLNFSCIKLDSTYLFSGATICKKSGIYVFSLGDLGSVGLIGLNCTRAIFLSSLKIENRNFELYEEKLGVRPDAIGTARGFCFRVL